MRSIYGLTVALLVCVGLASCVTETVDSSDAVKFTDTAIIAVQDPNVAVHKGSTFAWLPEAIRFYDDKRLGNAPIKQMLEEYIVSNLRQKEMSLVDSVNGAKYSIAYTAALESSLDDEAIIRRFGLMPGNSKVPTDDSNIEKGTLIIYVYENRTSNVVWRSAAQVGVSFNTSMEDRRQRTQRIISEMFQTFKVVK